MTPIKHILSNSHMKSNRILIEKSYKGINFTTGTVYGKLKPCFENGTIGNAICVSAEAAKEIFEITQEYNKLESIVWHNEFRFSNKQPCSIDNETIDSHKKLLEEALEKGQLVTKRYSKVIEEISNQVQESTGVKPMHLSLFFENTILRGHDELDTLMEDNWDTSLLKRKLVGMQNTLNALAKLERK